MTLLIDGYNLLHASGVFPATSTSPTLENARLALLDFLAASLAEKLVGRTTVVFDAANAPPGLPREWTHRGLAVRFARRGGSADELLEELIAAAPDPRNLLVVSSDHRVQRAARQRGASFADSESWHRQLTADIAARSRPSQAGDKPAAQIDNPFPPGYADDVARELPSD
jgi:predicted RNA-binding protein with PIN domain